VIIEIKGVGFENKGAHLMLLAIIEQVKTRWPDARIALARSCGTAEQRAMVRALLKWSLRKSWLDLNAVAYFLPRWLRRALIGVGVVTEADLDVVLDASGFAYSDQWPATLRMWHLKRELRRCKKHRTPYVFLPQAFGPFSDKGTGADVATSFADATLICAREPQSRCHITACTGPLDNLAVYGDFTPLVEGHGPASVTLGGKLLPLAQAACIVPNHNMLSARNTHPEWVSRYPGMLIDAIEYYRELGLTPFFLNHEGAADSALIAAINSRLPTPVVVENDPLRVKGLLGGAGAVLCSRYHGCISALSQGVACVGTSWSHKYDALYTDYGASELLLPPAVTTEQLRRVIDFSLDSGSGLAQRIRSRASVQKAASEAMWDLVQRTVDGYGQTAKPSPR
jgi:colanic acid/amylovoran biosynthesis protein